MKNTTKKILSMLLAVIMILSVMPVAFAAEKSVRDDFFETLTKLAAYLEYNSYEQEDWLDRLPKMYDGYDAEEVLEFYKSNDEEQLSDTTEKFKEILSEIEEKIANGDLTVAINGYKVAKIDAELFLYDVDYKHEIFERNHELFEEANAGWQLANDIRLEGGTQADYDAAVEKYIYAYSLALEHLYDNHDFIEYISNNDATEEANGTKTATCEFCGATDTVIDEDSKLVREPASFFERLIALIKEFFAKIFSIFS